MSDVRDETAGKADALLERVINGRFRVLEAVARGGMGRVYKGEQIALGRPCAIKVLDPTYSGSIGDEFHKRFFLEASTASKLSHPNNVTIYDYGQTEDQIYYIAMEFLEGSTLSDALKEEGRFTPERTAHIGRQLCRALREAHVMGVVHRDLKPANVFLVKHDEDGNFVKVLDFGLVKDVRTDKDQLTGEGRFMGSPRYTSPEQVSGLDVDARADIYALGVILYQMLTGDVPFERPTDIAVLMAHVNDPVPPMRGPDGTIKIPRRLERIVLKCLAKDRDARYATTEEVLNDLRMLDGSDTRSGSPSGSRSRDGKDSSGGSSNLGSGASASHGSSRPLPRQSVVPGKDGSPSKGTPRVKESSSGASPAVFPTPAPTRGRTLGPWPWVAAALLVGLPVALFFGKRPSASESAALPSSPHGEGNGTVVTPASAAPPRELRLIVSSEPAGAAVTEDGREVCKATPCEVVYQGADADPAVDHIFMVSSAGFETSRRSVRGTDRALHVKLNALKPTSTAVKPPTHHGGGSVRVEPKADKVDPSYKPLP